MWVLWMYRRTVISLLIDFSSETSEARRPFKCFKCWRENFQAKFYMQLNYLSKHWEKINIFRNMKTESIRFQQTCIVINTKGSFFGLKGNYIR